MGDKFPPPMTPEQLIALLDEFCLIALGTVKKSCNGQIFYTLSRDNIFEGSALLSGVFRVDDKEARAAYRKSLGE